MKDLKRFLIYGSGAAVVIYILSSLAASGTVSGGNMVMLAMLFVVVLPIAFSIIAAKRERQKQMDNDIR